MEEPRVPHAKRRNGRTARSNVTVRFFRNTVASKILSFGTGIASLQTRVGTLYYIYTACSGTLQKISLVIRLRSPSAHY